MLFKKAQLHKYFLSWFLFIFIVTVTFASYYRFVINRDYIVEYESTCDSTTEACFSKCEDDTCENKINYLIIRKQANDLYNECGTDITNCEVANKCLISDRDCYVEYCEPKINDNCESAQTTNNDTVEVEQSVTNTNGTLLDNYTNK